MSSETEQAMRAVLIAYAEKTLNYHCVVHKSSSGTGIRVKRSETRRDINAILKSLGLPQLSQKDALWTWFCETFISHRSMDQNILERLDSLHCTSIVI